MELAQQKVNKIGKKNHSHKSTWIAMLSCIFGMSVEKANAVVEHWNTVEDFKQFISVTNTCDCIKELQDILVTNSQTRKQRKLGPTMANRIYDVFCVNIVNKE